MKIVKQTKSKQEFEHQFLLQVLEFRQHTERIRNQIRVQRKLKEDLPEKHAYIHMDFVKDYRCCSQEEIQSKVCGIIHHQSFIFILDEPKHDVLHRLK